MFTNIFNIMGKISCVFLLVFSTIANATENLTIWSSHQDSRLLKVVIAKFKKKHDVNILVIHFDPMKIKAEILLSAQFGGLPNFLIMPSDFIGLHDQMKLTPIPDDWLTQPMSNNVKYSVILQNQYWGIPLTQGNFLMFYYNKALVKTPLTSWKAIIENKKLFTAQHIMPVGWYYEDMYYLMPFLSAFGGWPIIDNKFTLNTPQMVKALKYYRLLVHLGIVDDSCDYNCSQKRFINGKSAYLINGDWAYYDLKKALGDNLGVALFPTLNGKVMHPMSSTFVMSIPDLNNSSKEKQKLIKEFALFVQHESNQKQIYKKNRLFPVSATYFNQLKAAAKGNELFMFKQLSLSKEMPSSIKMAIAWQAIAIGFQRYQDGMTAEDAAKDMQEIAVEQYEHLEHE